MESKINKILAEMPEVKKNIIEKINQNGGLIEGEKIILEWINQIGGALMEACFEEITEPTLENEIQLDDKVMRFKHVSVRTIISRFGGVIKFSRRKYQEFHDGKWVKGSSTLCPLDEKLGLTDKGQYSPQLAYVISYLAGQIPYEKASQLLKNVVGISVGSTGIQKTAERMGSILKANAEDIIPHEEQTKPCELLIVSIDGTGSPRIGDEPCSEPGRASLSNPTITKMATVIQFEKFIDKPEPRESYADKPPKPDTVYNLATYSDNGIEEVHKLIRKGALLSGRNRAVTKVFKSDGLASNWKIYDDFFSDFMGILDPYHAIEHLANFCRIAHGLKDKEPLGKLYDEWRIGLLNGEILTIIEEMKEYLPKLKGDQQKIAENEINYFVKNREYMYYDIYLNMGIPIGSGNIESACKRVIVHRFKGQGMRWRAVDNRQILNLRLHILNNTLTNEYKKLVKNRWKLPVAA
jgi:hypothetical protein